MTAPGELRTRLVLEQPVDTPDGSGGVTRSYASVTTLWAALIPIAARAEVVADSLADTITHRVVIRSRTDVTTRHRLRAGARVFRIVASRDQDGRGRFLEIDAQERAA
jgi:SPP1 family predicted phage head-tail adaptor